MNRRLEDFVGMYTIRHGQGVFGVVEVGFKLCIGVGYEFGTPEPDGIRVGISIFDPEKKVRVLPRAGDPPAFAYLVNGTLNGSTYWMESPTSHPLLMAYQISLMTSILPTGGLYKAPSIMISIGDPQNAGVWGADDSSHG